MVVINAKQKIDKFLILLMNHMMKLLIKKLSVIKDGMLYILIFVKKHVLKNVKVQKKVGIHQNMVVK